MTTDAQRAAIKQMIERHTRTAVATKESARASLVKEGVYTKAGKLTEAFGGKKTAQR